MSKEEILELLDELVDRIEGPAKDVFDLAVRSVWTGALIRLLACGVAIVGLLLLARHARQQTRQDLLEFAKAEQVFVEDRAAREEAREKALAGADTAALDLWRYSYSYEPSPSRYKYIRAEWETAFYSAIAVSVIPAILALFALHDLLNAGFVALRMIVPGL